MTYLLVTLGVVAGFTLRCVLSVVADYRTPATPLWETPPRPQPLRTPACPQGWTAAQILGYYDHGARWHPPTYPGGLAAWDARRGSGS